MAGNLVIVEFKEEAHFLLENHPDLFKENVKVVALLPESSVVLSTANIPHENTFRYFSKRSHEQCLKHIDDIIGQINDGVKIEDGYGLKRTYINALTFYLRQYLGYIVHIIEVIRNILKNYPATKLHVCGYLQSDNSGFGLGAKERFLDDLAGFFRDRSEICLYACKIPPKLKVDKRKKYLKTIVSTVLFPLELRRLKKLSKSPFVFYSLKYYFDRIARHFKDNDLFNVVVPAKSFAKLTDCSAGIEMHNIHAADAFHPLDKKFQKSWRKAVDDIEALHYRKQLFSYVGHDFSSVIFRKMKNGYGPEMEKLNRQIGSLRRFYSKLKPAVVLSHVARDFSYALGELAQLMDIPSILISHGSHVPAKNEFEKMEWCDHGKGLIQTDYRYHLLQSPWAVDHVKTMGCRGNYYAIEPIIFPKVDRSNKVSQQLKMFPQSENKKIFVHAGTPKPRGSNRFYIYETLDEHVAYMCDLIEAARHVPDIFLIIRFRPYAYLSTEQLKALLPKGDHYVIATHGSFADYLKIADVLVSFSSTTIEEALINQIPVLQYDPSDRYMHVPAVKWQDKEFAHADSVYYIGGQSNLRVGLRWIVDNHLNTTLVGNLFERHEFQSGDAITVEEFIQLLLNKDLPQPIELTQKKRIDNVELY